MNPDMNPGPEPREGSLRDRLQTIASEANGTYTIHPFDGGLMLTIAVPGRGTTSVGYDDGTSLDTTLAMLRARLIDKGLIGGSKRPFNLTWSDGKHATIYAVDEAHAVRLAGRGQPEKIESGWPTSVEGTFIK